jgi:hypothetical protein
MKMHIEVNMKKSAIILFAVVAIFSLAQVAGAQTVKFLAGPYEAGNGGEFTLLPTGLGIGSYDQIKTSNIVQSGTFQTFCLETGEYISIGNTYNYVASNAATWGGVGPGGDTISQGTAYLYQEFALGTLGTDLAAYTPGSTYNYSGGATFRDTSAADLQNTIWYLENEVGASSLSTQYSNLLIAKFGAFGTATDAKADNTPGGYGVFALNLTIPGATGTDALAQDQLFYTGNTVTTPEPGSMLLLGFGLLGLFGVARRRFK